MAEMRKRTSMSVPEMGRMLGLGKTESYWLIKKNYFKTILYDMFDVCPPGVELKKTTYSME